MFRSVPFLGLPHCPQYRWLRRTHQSTTTRRNYEYPKVNPTLSILPTFYTNPRPTSTSTQPPPANLFFTRPSPTQLEVRTSIPRAQYPSFLHPPSHPVFVVAFNQAFFSVHSHRFLLAVYIDRRVHPVYLLSSHIDIVVCVISF